MRAQVEIYTGALPWTALPDGSGAAANPDFLNFPDWGFPEIRKLALQCMKVNPKERPDFVEIIRVLKVRRESGAVTGGYLPYIEKRGSCFRVRYKRGSRE